MELIKQTINAVICNLEKKNKHSPGSELFSVIKKVLAKKAISHVKLYNFKNGVLTLKVDSSTWLYYLSLQKEKLLVGLSSSLNNIKVKDIRFFLGE